MSVASANDIAVSSEWKAISEVTVDKPGIRNPINEPNKIFKYVDISSVDNKEKKIVKAKELLGSEAPSRARKVIRAGDVIVSTTRPNLNAVAVVSQVLDNEICSTGYCVLRPTEQILTDYLFYFVQSYRFVSLVSGEVSGAMYPATTDAKIRAVKIPVPPIQEQQCIVDILKRADGIRRLRKQAQDTARQLIPALFIDMFGDPLTNPKGWPEKSMGDLVSLHGGGTPSKKNPEYWGGVIPWVSPKDMKHDCISDSIDHVTPKALEETTLKWIPAESVLIVVRGMILMHTVPIRVNSSNITINQDMKALVPNEKLSANFLRWALQSMHSHVLSQVSTSAHGTRKLDTNRLLALSIPLPPLSMQEEFEIRLDSIQSILDQQNAAKNSAESSFQSLLYRAFNGLLFDEVRAI
ncbi:MAG: restriction endonuclease subunit S [Candidatus Thiodiazotropha endolucinida]